MASTPSSKSTNKSTAKPSKKIVLRLSPQVLARFASPSADKSETSPNASPAPTSTPTINAPAPEPSESNATPAPGVDANTTDNNSLAPPAAGNGKRKGAPGSKSGGKRSAAQAEGASKPRGKPGPKKKPRLADGTIDRSADGTKKGPFGGVAPISTHKLGPKANTGAINAGLRALDRSGKPCRKWERKGFELKSISGAVWTIGSWAAPPKDSSFSGDVKSESSGTSEVAKANMDSSAVPSDRSNSGDMTRQDNTLESSPAPALAAGT